VKITLAIVLLFLNGLAFAQTARQGETSTPPEFKDFRPPMILETIFLPADKTLWKKDGWITNADYTRLRWFRCENVSIVGLSMKAREFPKDKLDLSVKVMLWNPDRHLQVWIPLDKRVTLLFEVMNGEEIVGTFKLPPVKVFEGEVVERTIKTTLPLTALKADPMTKLRITMMNWDARFGDPLPPP
jgi:hypothetical protein